MKHYNVLLSNGDLREVTADYYTYPSGDLNTSPPIHFFFNGDESPRYSYNASIVVCVEFGGEVDD